MKLKEKASSTPAHLAPLTTSSVALLTTFRKNGQEVATPVGVRVVGDKVYFTTWSTTWKNKRIARNPKVTLAPCTRRGKVLGPTITGQARRLEGEEAKRKRSGSFIGYWLWRIIYKVIFRAQAVHYEIEPDLPE